MSEIKLLPCPFCGGEAKVINESECGFEYYGVMCFKCGTGTRLTGIEPVAIDLWNTRKPMERIVEKLEERQEESYRLYAIGFNAEDRGGYDAYSDAIEIVKEEGGLNDSTGSN